MRILVLADSHRDRSNMRLAIKKHPDIESVVFLGDGVDDFDSCNELLKGKRVYAVKGNNDFYCEYPENMIITKNGTKIYITHGHKEHVKYGLTRLWLAANESGCALALYGHTHIQKAEYTDGIYLFCPGSLRSGEYGIVDITDKGIMCIEMNVHGKRNGYDSF